MSDTHVFLGVALVDPNPSVCSKKEEMLSHKFIFQAEIARSGCVGCQPGPYGYASLTLSPKYSLLSGCSLLYIISQTMRN